MPLKAVLDNLDEVDEGLKSLYKPASVKGPDGKEAPKFVLDVEGGDALPFVAPLRNAHERQKQDNITLKAKLTELEGKAGALPENWSREEWDRLVALESEVKKQNQLDPEKRKTQEAELQSIKQMHEQAMERLKTKLQKDLLDERNSHVETRGILRGRVVGDDLNKALLDGGCDKRYLPMARAFLEKNVQVKEDGANMLAFFNTDLGDVPIGEYVPQWLQSEQGKLVVPQASGSGASGSDRSKGGSGIGDKNPWSATHWNTTQQAITYKTDQAKATRLAQAAGHASPIVARIEGAKDFDAKVHGSKSIAGHAKTVFARNAVGAI